MPGTLTGCRVVVTFASAANYLPSSAIPAPILFRMKPGGLLPVHSL